MKIKRRIAAFMLSMLFVGLLELNVYAHPVPEMDRLCSITFDMRTGDTSVGGGSLTLYRVGDVTEENGNYFFQPSEAFAGSRESLENLEEAELAERLKAYADRNAVKKWATKEIDSKGKVTFEKLPVGLYLVAQYEAATGYNEISPFLISLPYYENGEYQYDLFAAPKTELVPEPPEKNPPNIPQTGQLWWPVPLLICGGLLLFILGVGFKRRYEPDEG